MESLGLLAYYNPAHWESFPERRRVKLRAKSDRELKAVLERAYPVEARWGSPGGERALVLGPANFFEPYASHPARGKPSLADAGWLLVEWLTGNRAGSQALVSVNALYEPDGRRWHTPLPPKRRKAFMNRPRENPDEPIRELQRLAALGDPEAAARLQAARLRAGLGTRRQQLIARWEATGSVPAPEEWLGPLAPARAAPKTTPSEAACIWQEPPDTPGGLAFTEAAYVLVRPGRGASDPPWQAWLGTGGCMIYVRGPYHGGWTNRTDALAAALSASPSGIDALVQEQSWGARIVATTEWPRQWITEHSIEEPPLVRSRSEGRRGRRNPDEPLRRGEREAGEIDWRARFRAGLFDPTDHGQDPDNMHWANWYRLAGAFRVGPSRLHPGHWLIKLRWEPSQGEDFYIPPPIPLPGWWNHPLVQARLAWLAGVGPRPSVYLSLGRPNPPWPDADLDTEIEAARDQRTDRIVVLVSCAAEKSHLRSRARDLYTSDLFVKAREFVEALSEHEEAAGRHPVKWAILSAKHGLLGPNQFCLPYDLRLEQLNSDQRYMWRDNVAFDLGTMFPNQTKFMVLAGGLYEKLLHGKIAIHNPLRGLGVGHRKQWLKEAARALRA